MVDREIRDGDRIADLLQAEIEEREVPPFDEMAVRKERVDARETEPETPMFEVAYRGTTLASVYRQPDRIYLEFDTALDATRDRAVTEDLRTRPKATTPPGLIVFVETGASVKRALDVVGAAADDRTVGNE